MFTYRPSKYRGLNKPGSFGTGCKFLTSQGFWRSARSGKTPSGKQLQCDTTTTLSHISYCRLTTLCAAMSSFRTSYS